MDSHARKIILAGDPEVGKSNLFDRFSKGDCGYSYIETIHPEYCRKKIHLGKEKIPLQLVDTQGQEKFKRLGLTYFKKCSGVLLVYDISNKKSFENIRKWKKICKKNSPKNVLKVLVGNKCDLEDERQVSTEDGQKYADKKGMLFFETSAKTGKNVEEVFIKIAEEMKMKDDQKKGLCCTQ